MIEAIIGFGGVLYAVIALIYSVRMENNKVLKQSYKAKSDHDWSEICFAVGFAWPLSPIINYVMRSRNAVIASKKPSLRPSH